MKRIRHSPEQIVTKLHQAATELAGGKKIEEVCKGLAISPATYHKWRKQYGGMKADEMKRLKELEAENAKLKKMYADLALENEAIKGVLNRKL